MLGLTRPRSKKPTNKQINMADLISNVTSERSRLNNASSAAIKDATQLANYYTAWSNAYEQDMSPEYYVGPILLAEAICNFVPVEKRSEVTLMDVAAGTGLLGQELSQRGFTIMDALDASEGMLSMLKKKGTYRNTFNIFLGTSDATLPSNAYDVVTCCGGFIPGHVPGSAVRDLAYMCKPGGIVAIVMREEFLQTEDLKNMQPLMDEMEQKNVWQLEKRTSLPNYFLDKEGLILIYRKCASVSNGRQG